MADETQVAIPADAVARTWVRRAPAAWQPYLRLARLDRPIGTWLLFWPCVFGLALGAAEQHRGFLSTPKDWGLLALFALGAIAMRGAGCTYNDIVDRNIDARVARTRGRPIPSGAVTVKQAWVFLAAQSVVGLLILLCLYWFAIALGAASLILIAIYPFMKRITWWPQAWLGLTFNWGALLGFAAQSSTVSVADGMLYAACFFWTLGYDTIYALQDIEDDALVGVKSTARLFGPRAPIWISMFYLGFAILAALSVRLGFASSVTIGLLLPMAAHLLWQVRSLNASDTQNYLRLFRANRETGALAAAALLTASWIFS